MVLTTRFLVLALIAIAADLAIPVVHGAALPGKKFRDPPYDGEVDMVGRGVLGDLESGHMWKVKLFLLKDDDAETEMQQARRFGPPPTAPRERRSPNRRARATLDDCRSCPGESSLKRQLRALTIRIRSAIARIETLVFGNRSPWDCRPRKNPLKEIVIDIVAAAVAEIERPMAKDKKRGRDGHRELARCGGGYSQGNSPGSHEAPKRDGAEDPDLAGSSVNSLALEHRAEGESNGAGVVSSDANCDCAAAGAAADVGAKVDVLAGEFAKARTTEESKEPGKSGCYVKSKACPLKFPGATTEEPSRERHATNANANLNVNTFNQELSGSYANREGDGREGEKRERKEMLANDREIGNESSASEEELVEESSAEDGFSSKRENVDTNKNWNWNTNSNPNANAVDGNGERGDSRNAGKEGTPDLPAETSYNSRNERDKKYYQYTEGKLCENRQESATSAEETDIKSYTDPNTNSSSQNWRPVSVGEQFEATSPDDFDQSENSESRADTDEKDNRGAADLPLACANERSMGNEKTSTEDNRVDRQVNVDASIAENSDEYDLESCDDCTSSSSSSADQSDVEQNAKNINYNENRAKLDLAMAEKNDNVPRPDREVKSIFGKDDSVGTMIAREIGAHTRDDNDHEERVDEKLLGDTRLPAVAKVSTEVEDPSGTRSSKNLNVNVNVNSNRLIRPRRNGRKPRSAPAHPKEARRWVGPAAGSFAMRNEWRVDRGKREGSMNIAIDAVDEVSPDDTSRIAAARDSSRGTLRNDDPVGTNNGIGKRVHF